MGALPDEYGALVRRLHDLAAEQGQPVNGSFELTSRCNVFCRMCYINEPPGAPVRSRELSASAWLDLARQAVDHGMMFLLLTGGEIFLRPDFFEVYVPLTRLGLVITLFSNGTLISRDRAARLAENPPSRIEVSLYGATAATYESITRAPGSYARCCAGIEALVARGLPLALKSPILRQNLNEVDAMRQMARNWGAPFSTDRLLWRRRDGRPSDVDACRLTPDEGFTLDQGSFVPLGDLLETAPRRAPRRDESNFYCHAGSGSFVIGATGDMNLCLVLPEPKARPLEIGFAAAWQQLRACVATAPGTTSGCLRCNARDHCPRCPAWSYIENGTMNEPVPYLCEVAHAAKERADARA